MKRVVVVGGGLGGLTTAWELVRRESPPGRVTVLEAESRWGGLLQSRLEGGLLLEASADSVSLHKPEAAELMRQLGLEEDLVPLNPAGRQAYLWLDGRLEPFSPVSLLSPPVDLNGFLAGKLLTSEGAERLAAEPEVPARMEGDESVSGFTTRRLGPEFLERVVGPLVNGIYGCDADLLSVEATLPALVRCEREQGRVTAPFRRDVASRSGFMTLRGGIQQLIESLLEELRDRVELRTAAPVRSVSRTDGRWSVSIEAADPLEVDAVAVCTPAAAAAAILKGALPELSGLLRTVTYSPATLVAMAFAEVPLPSDCAGFLLPRSHAGPLMACSWSSNKFAGRAPAGLHLIRCFLEPGEDLERPKDRIAAVRTQLRREFGFAEPLSVRLFHWPSGLPRYGIGHLERIAAIEAAVSATDGLALVGNYFDGVGISDCVRRAQATAADLVSG